MRRVQIKDRPLQRDMHSKGIVLTDTKERDSYMQRQKLFAKLKTDSEEITSLRRELNELREVVDGLKNAKHHFDINQLLVG